jgi:hypothetical protein
MGAVVRLVFTDIDVIILENKLPYHKWYLYVLLLDHCPSRANTSPTLHLLSTPHSWTLRGLLAGGI